MLAGPTSGVATLPVWDDWGDNDDFDLDDDDDDDDDGGGRSSPGPTGHPLL